MKQKIFLMILAVFALTLTGCAKEAVEIGGIAQKANQDLKVIEEKRVQNRDWKRTRDLEYLANTIRVYADDNNQFPKTLDDKGVVSTLKLINKSEDFKLFETAIKSLDSSLAVPIDPLDPDRYYEYNSDGKSYSVKVYLEQDGAENCESVKKGYCQMKISEDLKTAQINYQKFLESIEE